MSEHTDPLLALLKKCRLLLDDIERQRVSLQTLRPIEVEGVPDGLGIRGTWRSQFRSLLLLLPDWAAFEDDIPERAKECEMPILGWLSMRADMMRSQLDAAVRYLIAKGEWPADNLPPKVAAEQSYFLAARVVFAWLLFGCEDHPELTPPALRDRMPTNLLNRPDVLQRMLIGLWVPEISTEGLRSVALARENHAGVKSILYRIRVF